GDELAREQHVADHAALAGDRLVRKEPGAFEQHTVTTSVAAPEQLVAAADGEQGRAAVDGGADRVALCCEVRRAQRLLAVLPAAGAWPCTSGGRRAAHPTARARARGRARPRDPGRPPATPRGSRRRRIAAQARWRARR